MGGGLSDHKNSAAVPMSLSRALVLKAYQGVHRACEHGDEANVSYVNAFERARARASWFRRCMNMAVSSLVRGGQIGL